MKVERVELAFINLNGIGFGSMVAFTGRKH